MKVTFCHQSHECIDCASVFKANTKRFKPVTLTRFNDQTFHHRGQEHRIPQGNGETLSSGLVSKIIEVIIINKYDTRREKLIMRVYMKSRQLRIPSFNRRILWVYVFLLFSHGSFCYSQRFLLNFRLCIVYTIQFQSCWYL